MKNLVFLISITFCIHASAANGGGFLFSTFRDETTPMSEQIYMAISEDGRQWKALKDGNPVLVSDVGEKGVRDSFLLRSADGKKVWLIATDLCVNRNRDWRRHTRYRPSLHEYSGLRSDGLAFSQWRRTPRGVERLVMVELGCGRFGPDGHDFGLVSSVYRANWVQPMKQGTPGLVAIELEAFTNMEVYAGQIDPKDESHFTIIYKLNGDEGRIEGWLRDSDTHPPDWLSGAKYQYPWVRLVVTTGPARACSTSYP